MQIVWLRIHMQHPGDNFTLGLALLQIVHRRSPVMHIVLRRKLAQPQYRAVVLRDFLHCPRRIVRGNRLARQHDIELVDGFVVLAHVVEAFGGPGMVVEGDAR